MADQELAELGPLRSRVWSWLRILLFLALSFVLHKILPIRISSLYLGRIYTWIVPAIVIAPPLAYACLKLTTRVARTVKSLPNEFRPILDAVDHRTMGYETTNPDDPVVNRMTATKWLEAPTTDTNHEGDIPITTYLYKITRIAEPYFNYYHKLRAREQSPQAR